MTRRTSTTGIALLVALSLTGCSQIAAIAPVGGDRLAEVRFAGIDVLVDADIQILEAPVCTEAADATVTCTGSTVDDDTITVASPGSDPDTLRVTSGDTSVYEGSLHAALEKAMGG